MNCPHWLLALTIPFSRSDRAHTCLSRCWCRVSRRTVPDEFLRRRVSFGCRRARGGRSDGTLTLPDATQGRQRARAGPIQAASRPRTNIWGSRVAGAPVDPADAPPARSAPPTGGRRRAVWGRGRVALGTRDAPSGGMRRTTRPSACHPVPEALRALPPHPFANKGSPKAAKPADLLDLPRTHSTTCVDK
jgi:hypothetical protein